MKWNVNNEMECNQCQQKALQKLKYTQRILLRRKEIMKRGHIAAYDIKQDLTQMTSIVSTILAALIKR